MNDSNPQVELKEYEPANRWHYNFHELGLEVLQMIHRALVRSKADAQSKVVIQALRDTNGWSITRPYEVRAGRAPTGPRRTQTCSRQIQAIDELGPQGLTSKATGLQARAPRRRNHAQEAPFSSGSPSRHSRCIQASQVKATHQASYSWAQARTSTQQGRSRPMPRQRMHTEVKSGEGSYTASPRARTGQVEPRIPNPQLGGSSAPQDPNRPGQPYYVTSCMHGSDPTSGPYAYRQVGITVLLLGPPVHAPASIRVSKVANPNAGSTKASHEAVRPTTNAFTSGNGTSDSMLKVTKVYAVTSANV